MDLINATSLLMKTTWIEQPAVGSFRIWHVMFMSFATVLALIIMVCCCIKIRIPRTKQEIEADYQRKKLTRKFRRQLKLINNEDIDTMDLKKALERIHKQIYSIEAPSDIEAPLSSSCNNSEHPDNVSSFESHKLPESGMTAEPQQASLLNRTFSQKVAALVKLSKLKTLPPVDDDEAAA